MGIKLMVEIFDHWQDVGLTVGERGDLLVLAENANDGTRLTFGPVHEPYILRRAGKTAASWRVAINGLMKKKVLEYASRDGRELRGRTGQYAVYRLVELCPDPPHSGHKGNCTKPVTATSSGREGHPPGDPSPSLGYPAANPEGYPSANPVDGEGYPAATEWVSSQITPTPPNPSFKISSTTSSSVAEVVADAPAVVEEVTGGGGGGSLDDSRSTAIYIAGALDYRGKPPTKQQRQTIEDRLTAALSSGWTLDGLALYLDLGDAPVQSPAAVYLHRLKPGVLPDAEPLDAPPRAVGIRSEPPTAAEYASLTLADVLGDGQPAPAPADRWAQSVARARSRLAGAGARGGTDDRVAGWGAVARQLGSHKPYSNDAWSTAAIEEDAAKIPHCGELDCDPVTRMRDGRDHNDLPYVSPCPKCHPRMQWG